MTLPLTRDITLALGTQIPSTLLNTLQDMIIGGKHGPKTIAIPGAAGDPGPSAAVMPTSDVFGSRWTIATTQIGEIFYPVTVAIGDRITDFRAFGEIQNAGDTFSVTLLKRAGTTSTAVLISSIIVSPSTVAFHKVGAPVSPGEVVVADTSYYIYVTGTAGAPNGMNFLAAEYTIDRV